MERVKEALRASCLAPNKRRGKKIGGAAESRPGKSDQPKSRCEKHFGAASQLVLANERGFGVFYNGSSITYKQSVWVQRPCDCRGRWPFHF